MSVDCSIGIIGAGTVGSGVIKIFEKQRTFFQQKLGLAISIKRIVTRTLSVLDTLPLNSETICSDTIDDILNDPEINIVVELIGGTTIAKDAVIRALQSKKHVVTANKALLAEYGHEIFSVAEENNVSVYFEASVGGGTPSIKTIRESLVGNDILGVKTIINGTCNYILSQMSKKGLSFETVLKDAQEAGFAEADPTLDINGGDAGHKVAIMASLLYGGYVPYDKIHMEGITGIQAIDIEYAESLGYCIKLLGIIKKRGEDDSAIEARVHPVMLHNDHILSSVSDEYNAVLLEGDAVGPILIYGKGAGEMPTASAVIGDIIDISRNITSNSVNRISTNFYNQNHEIPLRSTHEITGRYYLRFTVSDKPSVLASISAVLGNHNISIASVLQKEPTDCSENIPVIILTHQADEDNLQEALSELAEKEFIKEATQVIRIED